MRFDEYDLQKTAEAVFTLNPYVRAVEDSPESLKSFMVSMAYQYLDKLNYFSTYGFCLTAYKDPEGEIMVRASVSPSLVMTYLKDSGVELEGVLQYALYVRNKNGLSGFRMSFANGWTVSVQFGFGNYCENKYKINEKESDERRSKDAEIAAWDANGAWYKFEFDDVKGWCTADEVAQFIAMIAAMPDSIAEEKNS